MVVDPSPLRAEPPVEKGRRGWSPLCWVLLAALLARLVALAIWSDNLTDDRDGYLVLADGLAQGKGFVVPGTEQPTAYRPPLYPLALVPAAFLPSGIWTGALQVALGLLTVWMTWLLAQRLTFSRFAETGDRVALLAAFFVAFDPILLRYTTLPMTETLATLLVSALLVGLAPQSDRVSTADALRQSVLVGVLFGLAALCRPTVWAFAGLMLLLRLANWLMLSVRVSRDADDTVGVATAASAAPQRGRLNLAVIVVSAATVLLPWGLRNQFVFGRPILMTTHGGYTLLLGNNPDFDRDVVTQPFGTVWDGTQGGGQQAWVERVNAEMANAGIVGEVAQDRWLKDRALANISADPSMFLRACWLRLRRFWGLMPVEGASDQSAVIRWSVGVFYGTVFFGAILGVMKVIERWTGAWWPPLLMVAAFMGVHLIYWTNTRMRAPIMPVIAVLAAIGWCQLAGRLDRMRSPTLSGGQCTSAR